MTIGNAAIISVAKARDEAKKILGQASLGHNPKHQPESNGQIISLEEFIVQEYAPWSKTYHQWSSEHIKRLYRMTPFLSMPIKDISPHTVEKWRAGRLSGGLSPATVNRDITALKAAL